MKRYSVGLVLLVLPLAVHPGFSIAGVSTIRERHDDTGISEAYGKLPLSFEQNRGQFDSRVKFLARGHGYSLFLTSDGATLSLRRGRGQADPHDSGASGSVTQPSASLTTEKAVVRMRLRGGRSAQPTGIDELATHSNYFVGSDPASWQTEVGAYAKVQYPGMLPGIDLVYYGTGQRQLEYDLVVAPGADPRSIELEFEGADRVTIDDSGALVLALGDSEVRQPAPAVYQSDRGGERKLVAGRYSLRAGGAIGFEIGAFDRNRVLVIDPTLTYSTYLGGSNADQANAVAIDASGNVYVAGSTESTNYPTTAGAFQPASAGGLFDAFVTKLNPSGSALVYSTYLGGSNIDGANAVAVDASGNVYVAGSTNSSNYPTTSGAFQTTFQGVNDAFVTKLNASGGLVYSTYLGGANDDGASAASVDASGNVYVAGSTSSSNYPTTSGVFQTVNQGASGGNKNAFVTKLNSSGSALVFSTFLGGAFGTLANAMAIDASGSSYVAGSANASYPTTAGAFQTAYAGTQDAFAAKLNSNGSALVYSTYLGGASTDSASAVAVDASGNAYVAGSTSSSNYPTTAGAFQTANPGGFLTKVNSSGSALAYSTYLGSSVGAPASAVAVDASGNAYVVGFTGANYPTTANAFQTANAGQSDAFMTKMNSSGSGLLYSTYLGGSNPDFANALAIDANGNVYVVGHSSSINYPTTPAAFQTAFAGTDDAFVSKVATVSGAVPAAGSIAVAMLGLALLFVGAARTRRASHARHE
jgi:hypothetical protein